MNNEEQCIEDLSKKEDRGYVKRPLPLMEEAQLLIMWKRKTDKLYLISLDCYLSYTEETKNDRSVCVGLILNDPPIQNLL